MLPQTVRTGIWTSHLVLVLMLFAGNSAGATSVDDLPDPYTEIQDKTLKAVFLDVLSADGESLTDKLLSFHEQSGTAAHVSVFVVQDRGNPRGAEYPTYVFRTGEDLDAPVLVFKTYAGPRLYRHGEGIPESGCLLSAEKGYSDVCLADVQGNAASDLPGLRKDFWSDLIKLFGL